MVDYLNEGGFENRKEQKNVHVETLCEMMDVLTGDTRFTQQVEELLKRQEEGGKVLSGYVTEQIWAITYVEQDCKRSCFCVYNRLCGGYRTIETNRTGQILGTVEKENRFEFV